MKNSAPKAITQQVSTVESISTARLRRTPTM